MENGHNSLVFIIYVIGFSTKNKIKRRGLMFLQKSKIQTVGNRKKNYFFFSYFISEIPNFSYVRFFRKCSMFRRSIPLNQILSSGVFQKSAWFDSMNCSLLYKALLLMFEHFYNVYNMMYQFLTVDQNKGYYFCKLFLKMDSRIRWSGSF